MLKGEIYRTVRSLHRSLSMVNAGGLVGSLSLDVETSGPFSKGVVVGRVVNGKVLEGPRI